MTVRHLKIFLEVYRNGSITRASERLHMTQPAVTRAIQELAQSSPGAIAVNAAILVGWRVGGALGMAVAVVGTILPPMIILSVISLFYAAFATNPYVALVLRGMQAGVAAVILDVVCSLGAGVVKERSALSIVLMIAAFLATFVLDVNVVYIILAAALVGVGKILVLRRARKEGAK